MEKFFKVSDRGSSAGQEVRAGFTTFLAMAYIIAVNPGLMALAGVPITAAVTAVGGTALGGDLGGMIGAATGLVAAYIFIRRHGDRNTGNSASHPHIVSRS